MHESETHLPFEVLIIYINNVKYIKIVIIEIKYLSTLNVAIILCCIPCVRYN